MRGKLLVAIVLLLVASVLMASCESGVSQKDYDKVVAERNTALAKRDALQGQIQSLQTELEECQAKCEAGNESVDALQAQIADLQSQIQFVEGDVSKAADYAAILSYMAGWLESQEDLVVFAAELQDKANALDDWELQSKVWDMLSAMQTSAVALAQQGKSDEEIRQEVLQTHLAEYSDVIKYVGDVIMGLRAAE